MFLKGKIFSYCCSENEFYWVWNITCFWLPIINWLEVHVNGWILDDIIRQFFLRCLFSWFPQAFLRFYVSYIFPLFPYFSYLPSNLPTYLPGRRLPFGLFFFNSAFPFSFLSFFLFFLLKIYLFLFTVFSLFLPFFLFSFLPSFLSFFSFFPVFLPSFLPIFLFLFYGFPSFLPSYFFLLFLIFFILPSFFPSFIHFFILTFFPSFFFSSFRASLLPSFFFSFLRFILLSFYIFLFSSSFPSYVHRTSWKSKCLLIIVVLHLKSNGTVF